MSQALLAYQVRRNYGKWGALSAEQELIVALQAQVDSIKDPRLKLDNALKKKANKRKKKVPNQAAEVLEREQAGRERRPSRGDRWQDKNPQGQSVMTKNGTKYRWCKHHNQGKGMWVTHKLEDCRNRA